MSLFAPLARSSKPELLDAPVADRVALAENLRDLRLTSAALRVGPLVLRALRLLRGRSSSQRLTILDVATGGADLPRYLEQYYGRAQQTPLIIGSDRSRQILELIPMQRTAIQRVQHDALALPVADGGVEVVLCTMALHHFEPPQAIALLRELARAARLAAIVLDLRRCWPAYLGARALACGAWHTMARHDGPLSVQRAYTLDEARALLKQAGVAGEVQPAFPFLMALTVRGSRFEY
jgi:hypothetical protein